MLLPLFSCAAPLILLSSSCGLLSTKPDDPEAGLLTVAVDASPLPTPQDGLVPLNATITRKSARSGGGPTAGGQVTAEEDADGVPGVAAKTGKIITYVTRKGDTLMKISFKTLGSVYRWKEIYRRNKSKLPKPSAVPGGVALKIDTAGAVRVSKNGLPYLIKRRDTLWKISENVYRTPWKWSSIWKNNRELIHDPNWIYAGFNLYYRPQPQAPETPRVPQVLGSIPEDGSRKPASVDAEK